MKNDQVIKNYRRDDRLRASFNELAQKTFQIEFEDWYQNGYWSDKYNPYSIVIDGKIAANVSVSRMDFILDGYTKHYLQLGTVMTAEPYRRQGLIRRIMEEIERDYSQGIDGIFLFANDSVLDFYPKFGFRRAKEYQYAKEVSVTEAKRIVQVPMREKKDWDILERAVRSSVPCGSFEMTGNSELIMFYVTKFMQDQVFYDRQQDAYVIAEQEADELVICNVFSPREVNLDELIGAFGRENKKVRFGFTPKAADAAGCTVSELKEQDTTLFVKGRGFSGFEERKLMIPVLAHT
ncbi:MAG: GNAT family N-acetyltransferase [Lachnospiraceae bacterium]|nr:GNAT family N-acetyltransferase [Lachnospiraceae bacterium]